jgi:hypothetical protein
MELAKQHLITGPGYYDGRHFVTYGKDLENLRRSGEFVGVEGLLLELVNGTEAENAVRGWGVAPTYYSELAILYLTQKEYSKRVSILERFERQKHAPGVMPAKLLTRLNKAKELLCKAEF